MADDWQRMLKTVRDAVVRGTQVGKAQLDLALARRERLKALAEVGERVAAAVDAGKLKVSAEVADALRKVHEIEERMAGLEHTAEGTVSSREARDSDSLDDDEDD